MDSAPPFFTLLAEWNAQLEAGENIWDQATTEMNLDADRATYLQTRAKDLGLQKKRTIIRIEAILEATGLEDNASED